MVTFQPIGREYKNRSTRNILNPNEGILEKYQNESLDVV